MENQFNRLDRVEIMKSSPAIQSNDKSGWVIISNAIDENGDEIIDKYVLFRNDGQHDFFVTRYGNDLRRLK